MELKLESLKDASINEVMKGCLINGLNFNEITNIQEMKLDWSTVFLKS